MAIIFDEHFNRISVGSHLKAKLKSFGIVFDQKPKPLMPHNKTQTGKIIKIQPQKSLLKTTKTNYTQKS